MRSAGLVVHLSRLRHPLSHTLLDDFKGRFSVTDNDLGQVLNPDALLAVVSDLERFARCYHIAAVPKDLDH